VEELFIAVGSTELSNKMESYTTDQKVFVIITFSSSGGSFGAVETQYRREFSVSVAHEETLSTGLLNSFKKRGDITWKMF
jgi:hypothetical protein